MTSNQTTKNANLRIVSTREDSKQHSEITIVLFVRPTEVNPRELLSGILFLIPRSPSKLSVSFIVIRQSLHFVFFRRLFPT